MRTPNVAFQPTLECLEERYLPAATITSSLLADGTLRVYGTDQADSIIIRQTDNQISVTGIAIKTPNGALVNSVNANQVKSVEAFGYAGNDMINAETLTAPVKIWGDVGNDLLVGGKGNDWIYGGAGDDNLQGGPGDDHLNGEDGNDVIHGGDGTNFLAGGAGQNTLDESAATGPNPVVPSTPPPVNGTTAALLDDGTLRIYGTAQADNIVLQQINNQISVTGVTIKTVTGAYVNAVNVNQVKSVEAFGYAGNDVIRAESLTVPVKIWGDVGNDLLVGGKGNDWIYGGAGDDALYGGPGDDHLNGEDGNDLLIGGDGNDSLAGGAGQNTLTSDGPATTATNPVAPSTTPPASGISASLLADGTLRIIGTDQADNITVQQKNGQISIDGVAIKTVSGIFLNAVDVALVKSIEIHGGAGDDTIKADTLSLAVKIWGDAGNDKLSGGSGNDWIYGGSGDDTIYGGAGNDNLYGEDGEDVIFGQEGNDFLSGGAGRDSLVGGASLSANDFDHYQDDFDLTKPIAGGATPDDVRQLESPICQILATLATVSAQKGSNFIASHIKYLGGTNYQVFLEGEGKWINVTFDGSYTDTDAKPNTTATSLDFWTILFTRARLQTFGISTSNYISSEQFNQLNESSGYRLKSNADSLEMVLGKSATLLTMDQASFSQVQSDLAAGKALQVATYYADSSGINALGIAANHSYAVIKAFTQNGVQYVQLYNPWGTDSLGSKTIDLVPGAKASNDGFITITWADFTNSANFATLFVV